MLEKRPVVDFTQPYRQHRRFACGPAALKIAYSAFGLAVEEADLVKELNIDRTGTSWPQLIEHILDSGFPFLFRQNANYPQLLYDHQSYGCPIIIEFEVKDDIYTPAYHFSVATEIAETYLVLADPRYGKKITHARDKFTAVWRGAEQEQAYLVLLDPTS
jgi:predicted double-glycine peptidase